MRGQFAIKIIMFSFWLAWHNSVLSKPKKLLKIMQSCAVAAKSPMSF